MFDALDLEFGFCYKPALIVEEKEPSTQDEKPC